MNYLDAVLLAQARERGRGVRSARFRHRHITKRPMGLVLWQLGAEPFTVGAAAWGFSKSDRNLVVPGEPRNRDLAFRALLEVAKPFNAWFMKDRADAPQVVLLNRGNLSLLSRIARRIAYLPTTGDRPAPQELVMFGRHLRFLVDQARYPGQQLVLILTELLRDHWVTELSELETQNLAALDAAIAPPKGLTGHEAAVAAETLDVGPVPTGDEDERLDPLVRRFNERRRGSTEEKLVAPLRGPIERHYRGLVYKRGWPLLWRALERERKLPEAPSVKDRWNADVDAYQGYLEWVNKAGGRRRVRQTAVQAARTLRRWEEAERLRQAHEALDDPLRMIPAFLRDDALVGRVVEVDLEHRERPNIKLVRRPLVTLHLASPCRMPLGKQLYWTQNAKGKPYTLVRVGKGPAGKGTESRSATRWARRSRDPRKARRPHSPSFTSTQIHR